MQTSKGFTIIELLVVIAIIAVLASIVLVSVTQYIASSKDAAIKENLSSAMVNGAKYFDDNSNYTDFCTSGGISTPENAITAAGGTPMHICTDTAWCGCSTMVTNTGNVFCVDSTGYKKQTTNDCATACDAGGACQ